AVVKSFAGEGIRDHYVVFGLVYGLAARRAVLRGDPEFVQRLSVVARSVAATEDPIELEKLPISFHSTIVEAAKSPRIPTVLRAMSALVPGHFFVLVPHAMEVEKKGLAAIVRAIKKGDGDRAAAQYEKM